MLQLWARLAGALIRPQNSNLCRGRRAARDTGPRPRNRAGYSSLRLIWHSFEQGKTYPKSTFRGLWLRRWRGGIAKKPAPGPQEDLGTLVFTRFPGQGQPGAPRGTQGELCVPPCAGPLRALGGPHGAQGGMPCLSPAACGAHGLCPPAGTCIREHIHWHMHP